MTSVLHGLFVCFAALCSQRMSFELGSAVFLVAPAQSARTVDQEALRKWWAHKNVHTYTEKHATVIYKHEQTVTEDDVN